jgi:hypothetical protein
MKLHDFIVNQANDPVVERIKNVGRALAQPAPAPVVEAKRHRPAAPKPMRDEEPEGMDAAIMILTQGHKAVHSKIKHHD